MRICRLAVFGFFGGTFRIGNDLPPFSMRTCRRAACTAACNLSDEDSSRGQNTCCDSWQQEAGVTSDARRNRAALSRNGGVAPASLRVLAASDSCALSPPSGSFIYGSGSVTLTVKSPAKGSFPTLFQGVFTKLFGCPSKSATWPFTGVKINTTVSGLRRDSYSFRT
jgi:hypothetical protein